LTNWRKPSARSKKQQPALKGTDERLNAFIKIVDGMNRNPPHPNTD